MRLSVQKVLDKREAELAANSSGNQEELVARARELDQRELELSARASDLTARLEQLRAILGNATGSRGMLWHRSRTSSGVRLS